MSDRNPPGSAGGPALWRLLDQVADAVSGVRAGRSLSDLLPRVPVELRPGTQALASDVLRRLGGAVEVRARLAARTPPPAVDALLLGAIALLWPPPAGQRQAYPDHTLVDQAVAAAQARTPAAAGFVNAVLRRFVRERDALVAAAQRTPVGAFDHPSWWIEKLRRDWPQHWQTLLAEANRRPPLVLRVNRRRRTGADYVLHLAALGLRATLLPDPGGGPTEGSCAVWLHEPRPVHELPGFAEGEVSVQDAAAQRAAPLLLGSGEQALQPGARVLDACAAPGGKTAHLLELADLRLLALDSDPARLARVGDNLRRLRLQAEVKAGDAAQPAGWWDGQPFDAILLDAPCTASGIGRRHPDVRWLRRADDVHAMARIQDQLLEALWPLLVPGGRLLYATCSVFRDEGQHRIDAFLQRHGPGGVSLVPGSPGHLLPVADNVRTVERALPAEDGFFYALLAKN
ncbi:MAG: 16S rRNA (cytosine(967)-C(5))-methyltransferase RsmB [Pseudomonadota bacterium]|nr:16S rRNA (cytosine(967)-C(5))-methyltransferase RsmB [Rubrivivax sp.]